MKTLKNDFIDLFQKLDYFVQRSKVLFKNGVNVTDTSIKIDYADLIYVKYDASKVLLRCLDSADEEIAAISIDICELLLNDPEWEIFVADYFEKQRLAKLERSKRTLVRLVEERILLEIQIQVENDKAKALDQLLYGVKDKERLTKDISKTIVVMNEGELKRKKTRLDCVIAEIAKLRKTIDDN